MEIVENIICWSAMGCTLALVLVYLILWIQILLVPSPKNGVANDSKVSLIIAMRNEVSNLDRCLQAVQALDYPAEELEILIGDDGSTDGTLERLIEWERKMPNLKVIEIEQREDERLNGKRNALAQLCAEASGELLAFTDADIALPEQWLGSYVTEFKHRPKLGIAMGATGIKDHGFQDLEWISALGMIHAVSEMNMPVTALGNNMVIRKSAYEAVGGFENLKQTPVEDFAMFHKIVKTTDFDFSTSFHKGVLAESAKVNDLKTYLMQRKRWMQGAMLLPLGFRIVLFLQVLFYPVLIAAIFFNPLTGILLLLIKAGIQSVFQLTLYFKLRKKLSIFAWIFYEIYAAITSVLNLVFFVLPVKIEWKGRQF